MQPLLPSLPLSTVGMQAGRNGEGGALAYVVWSVESTEFYDISIPNASICGEVLYNEGYLAWNSAVAPIPITDLRETIVQH